MLKYQKAKAKLIEYGVEKADYPAFPLDSNELSYSTVYIISRYAESIIEDDSVSRNDFFNHLKFASQYFDAAVSADDRNTHDLDFLLSGAAAYFLSNDFGSAKVLCSKIDTNLDRKSPQGLLLSLFRSFLLNKVFLAPIKIQTTIDSFIRDIKRFFDKGQLDKSFYSKALEIREMVYDQDNPLDVYYVDILLAVLFESINHSSWVLLPRYTSLNNNEWITYLSSKKAIKILWPSQQLICEKGILKGANAIVQLPTGVGKTKSIELVIRSAFYTERANNAIIIAPLRSLCNEITYDLTQSFEEGIAINQFSDVLQDDYTFSFTNDENKNNVMVCTPEKLSYIMHHQPDCISEFDLFIFDEAHMFDDGYRGVTYEFLVSEIKNKVGVSKQIILLSAVLSNANEINNWLFDGQGVLASDEQIKPTPKSIGFVSTTRDMYYFTSKSAEFDFYIPRSIDIKALQKKQEIRMNSIFHN